MSEQSPRLSLDEALENSSGSPGEFLCALERDAASQEKVKITPYHPAAGCLCSLAFTMRKEAINEIRQTAISISCCGRSTQIFEVMFNNNEFSLNEIFSQLVQMSAFTMAQPRGPSMTAQNSALPASAEALMALRLPQIQASTYQDIVPVTSLNALTLDCWRSHSQYYASKLGVVYYNATITCSGVFAYITYTSKSLYT